MRSIKSGLDIHNILASSSVPLLNAGTKLAVNFETTKYFAKKFLKKSPAPHGEGAKPIIIA